MKIRNLLIVTASLGLVAGALAGEEMKTNIAISVADHDMGDVTSLVIDSEDFGFDLQDMQEGENRSIVDKSGRNILVTREKDGFRFDVDGKSIRMPLFGGDHHGAVWIGNGAEHENVEVHMMGGTGTAMASPVEDVMIFSGKPIDDATQQAIRSMLESAGHGSDVRFVDRESSIGGMHGVNVIEKRVEVIQ